MEATWIELISKFFNALGMDEITGIVYLIFIFIMMCLVRYYMKIDIQKNKDNDIELKEAIIAYTDALINIKRHRNSNDMETILFEFDKLFPSASKVLQRMIRKLDKENVEQIKEVIEKIEEDYFALNYNSKKYIDLICYEEHSERFTQKIKDSGVNHIYVGVKNASYTMMILLPALMFMSRFNTLTSDEKFVICFVLTAYILRTFASLLIIDLIFTKRFKFNFENTLFSLIFVISTFISSGVDVNIISVFAVYVYIYVFVLFKNCIKPIEIFKNSSHNTTVSDIPV